MAQFWKVPSTEVPVGSNAVRIQAWPAAGPAMRYLNEAAQALHAPQGYIDSVLPKP